MTDRDFIYWLRGFYELNNPKSITEAQTEMIKEHLDKVFDNTKEEQRIEYQQQGYTGYSC